MEEILLQLDKILLYLEKIKHEIEILLYHLQFKNEPKVYFPAIT